MKKLNLRFLLSGIFLLSFFSSLFLVSCTDEVIMEKETITESETITPEYREPVVTGYSLPMSIVNNGKEAISEYIKNLDAISWEKAKESYRISQFLEQENLTAKIALDNQKVYADIELSKFLSPNQLNELDKFKPEQGLKAACSWPYKPTSSCSTTGQLIHVGIYRYCSSARWVDVGRLWICTGQGWEEAGDQPYHYITTTYWCSGGAQSLNCQQTLHDCNSAGLARVNSTHKNVSLFMSKELSSEAKSIQNLYINHSDRLKEIFTSDDPMYNNVQDEFDMFLEEVQPLLYESFLLNKNMPIGTENIQRTLNLIQELSLVIEDSELAKELEVVSYHLEKEKETNNGIKTFLRNYGK